MVFGSNTISGTTVSSAAVNKKKKKKSSSNVDKSEEVDYDENPTKLYKEIEDKNWDKAINRIDASPNECRTWVFRRTEGRNKVRWRLLPIHATCIFRSPLSVIEALVAVYPEGARQKDDQDMLPVHLACRNGASKGVVMTLLHVFPEGIDAVDRKGRTPLQLAQASTSQNRDSVIQALNKFIQDNTGDDDCDNNDNNNSNSNNNTTQYASQIPIITEVDYENRTQLFRLVIKKEWDCVSDRCTSHPLEANTWIVTKGFHGNLRFLPLHKACVLQPPISVIQSLLHSNPEGAKSTDQDGWLPLHCASFYGATEDIVEALLLANPNGAHTKDDEGRMPLHYASLKAAEEGVTAALLRSNPKAAVSKDDEGRLPIHHACSKGASHGAIEALLKVSPKGSQSKDDQGRLPLHHACRKGAGERVVRALLKIYPRGAQVKDDQEKLAIHYACQSGTVSEGVISLLMNTYPESVNSKNGFGYTPIAEARAMSNTTIVKQIEKFKAKHDLITDNDSTQSINSDRRSTSGRSRVSNADVEDNYKLKTTVTELSERVNYLESLLAEVAQIGAELSSETKETKEAGEGTAVYKLANRLASVKPVGR